jgi:hypothetical protein
MVVRKALLCLTRGLAHLLLNWRNIAITLIDPKRPIPGHSLWPITKNFLVFLSENCNS